MVYAQAPLAGIKIVKTCVLIPTYNEARAIGPLVRQIREKNLDVIVIDDGSCDNTAEIAQAQGAFTLRFNKNRGKGASLKYGLQHILARDYEAVIIMDGDGQHSPEDIDKFMRAAETSDADMIVGNRMPSSKQMPPIRWLTNKFTSFLVSLVCKQQIPDSQCGFRLIKRALLQKLKPVSENYEIESEILIQACQKGFKVNFIPIRTIYAREVSQINPLIDTIRFFKFILKFFVPLPRKKNE